MPPLHRCTCISRGCKDVVDPKTGETGVMIDSRNLRKHIQDDKNATVRRLAEDTQRRVLLEHETRLSEALENMSVSDPPSSATKPLPDQDKYRADTARRLLSHIGDIKDELSLLQVELDSIGTPSHTSLSDHVLLKTLQEIGSLRTAAEKLDTRLRMITRRSKIPSVVSLRDDVAIVVQAMLAEIQTVTTTWQDVQCGREAQREAELASGAVEYDSSYHFQNLFRETKPIIQLSIFMVVVCHVILGFSRRGCYWLFSMAEFIIQTVYYKAIQHTTLSPYFQEMLSGFPRDIRTATAKFNLEPKTTIYAVCPKCHATYKPEYEGPIAVYQERCNFRRYASRCGEMLVRPKSIRGFRINVPIKTYISFDFKDWLAGLLARPGYEEMMDGAWQKMAESPEDGSLTDIFHGSIIRGFKGPDKRTHFSLSGGANTGRYLFAMSFDSFNPLRNLAAGKKPSIGVITLSCVNLPIERRVEPENMFLSGIVPGPHEPPLDAINPYMRPLVDTFLQFWDGVRFTRTCMYELGRLVLCAIILIICDSPAARKVGAFASHRQEYFCTRCWCNKTTHGYRDIDMDAWVPRTNEDCRTFADRFRLATSAAAAQSSFDRTGLRWSEFLRLPYFDPPHFVVVDPMHNLFLGLIKAHFQDVLGYKKIPSKTPLPAFSSTTIRVNIAKDPTNPVPEPPGQRASVRKLVAQLEQPLKFDPNHQESFDAAVVALGKSGIHVAAFVHVGIGIGCLPKTMNSKGYDDAIRKKSSKKDLAARLLTWRRIEALSAGPQQSHVSGPRLVPGAVFTTKEMEMIWEDLENIVKPSWVTSVPTTLSSSGPKQHADQWRAVGSLYLPVTLIRLWSEINPEDEHSVQCGELLHLTMLLFSAIAVATPRGTSPPNAAKYHELMLTYRQELQRLLPDYPCQSIHHMALHIGEFLLMYGPVHGWWAFPYERMIGMLQRIKTNYKQGEYEETIGRSWHRSSNLRGFFSKKSCPSVIRYCVEFFDTLVRPQDRNALAIGSHYIDDDSLEDDDDHSSFLGREEKVTPQLRATFAQSPVHPSVTLPEEATAFTHVRHRGTAYSVSSRHEGNSNVLLKGSDTPFRIEQIFRFPENRNANVAQGTWVILRRHRPAYIAVDPYRRYPYLRMRLWSQELEPSLEAVRISDVDAHFATLAFTWQNTLVAVVVSLSKVLLV